MKTEYMKMAIVRISSVGNCKCYVYDDGRISYNSTSENVRFTPEDTDDVRAYDLVMASGE